MPPKELRKLVDKGKKELSEGIIIVFASKDDKVGLAVGVTEKLTSKFDAVQFVKVGSKIIGGQGGGGRKDFAQAGGQDKSKIEDAFEKLKDLSVEATFDNKIVEGFNFSTGTITSSDQSYVTYGFLTTKESYANGTPVTKTTLTVRNNTDVTFDRYSEVTIGNSSYNCNIVSKDDFICTIDFNVLG